MQAREGEMPALKSALVALDAIDFPERQAVVADLGQRIKKLTALHEESAAAVAKPKAARRPALAAEIRDELSGLIDTLDKLSLRLNKLVNFEDAFIDRLDGAQAARLDGARHGRRGLDHGVRPALRDAAGGRYGRQIRRLREQVRDRVGIARAADRRHVVAGPVLRCGRDGQTGILRT